MPETTINDFQESIEAIAALLAKYDSSKGAKWLKQGVEEQYRHVRGHADTIGQMVRSMPMEAFNFEEFVSLGCRGLMLLQHAIMRYPEEFQKWKEDAKTRNTSPSDT